jgi:nucleoside-diphosphate-sugar epimerase
MRIFLTGGTGYIGTAVLDALIRAGHSVTALARHREPASVLAARGATPVIGTIADPETFRTAASGHDAFVHAAADAPAARAESDRRSLGLMLDRARDAGPATPVIYTSGVWVLGHTRAPADESAPVNPTPHVSWRPAVENLVLGAAGARGIVVRPGIVYGGSRGIIGDLLRDAANGLIRIVGRGDNHWPLVYDRDLGDLYARLIADPGASGLYHANDEGDERVNDIVEAVAATRSVGPSIRHMPLKEAAAKMGGLADAMALDQIVRSPRARALGWSPTLRSVARNAARLAEEWRSGREAA